MAREVGAIVVGVVVGYFAGPQAGIAAAGLVYGMTAPNAKQEGPKLTDLKAPSATYGSPIFYIEGGPRIAGNYIWGSEKHQIANESSQGGKGGPGVDTTLYTYEIDVLIECSINELAATTRTRRPWRHPRRRRHGATSGSTPVPRINCRTRPTRLRSA